MRNDPTMHVTDLLPAHLNGTLGPREAGRVCEHLRACPLCRAELASWEAVRGATITRSAALPPPPEGALERVWERVDEYVPGGTPRWGMRARLSLAWQLLLGQVPLVRREIWAASAFTMALGCAVALLATGSLGGGTMLAVFAPMIAAVGVAFLYGPENDPSIEVALSTPTRPGNVLLARLTLVYGYDLALAYVATAVLAVATDGVGAWGLILLWVGPMLFLSALALLLSLLFGPAVATCAAMALWATKVWSVVGAGGAVLAEPVSGLFEAFWQANAVLLALGAALVTVAVLWVPRSGRIA